MAQQTYGEWMRSNPPIPNLTAVEWLVNYMLENFHLTDESLEKFEQAKQMEKEQIIKAFSAGQETPINHPTLPHYSREEYYNETYNK